MHDMVVRAGHMSGRDVNKVAKIGFVFKPVEKLQNTRLVAGFEVVFEMVVWKELEGLATDHAQFVFDVGRRARSNHTRQGSADPVQLTSTVRAGRPARR